MVGAVMNGDNYYPPGFGGAMNHDQWKTTDTTERPGPDSPWEYDPKTDEVHCIGCGCAGGEAHVEGCQFDYFDGGHPI